MKKTVEKTLLERRSIRRYEYDMIPREDLDFIYEAIRNTPTSYNGEQFTVIDIDDQELKLKLYEITGQKNIKTCDRFMVFCADFNKINLAAIAKGLEPSYFSETTDGYTVGVIDASLALMSALVAAESRGLATCPIGYIRTVAPAEVAALLKLPKGVTPVCGLTLGVPRELPDMKPKQSRKLLIHNNSYRSDDLTEELLKFDSEISEYNRTRAGGTSDNDWAGHILSYYREGEKTRLLEGLRAEGFLTREI